MTGPGDYSDEGSERENRLQEDAWFLAWASESQLPIKTTGKETICRGNDEFISRHVESGVLGISFPHFLVFS